MRDEHPSALGADAARKAEADDQDSYQHAGGGPQKDTSIILPRQTLTVDFAADNPGLWVAHCHNIYRAESGMTTAIGYRQ